MPLIAIEDLRNLLTCPRCQGSLTGPSVTLVCSRESCKRKYDAIGEPPKPILIDGDKSIVNSATVISNAGSSQIKRIRSGGIRQRVMHRAVGRNKVAEQYVHKFSADLLAESRNRPRVLIIGGGAVGSGTESLYINPRLDLIAFDIYNSENVQFIADGHQIPLNDGCVDGVLVQAVLEHVLEPNKVVAEIYRVLRPGGLVYADTPFMQQVHEGPYDFTRFTDSGHRYLFRNFAARETGAVAGLGTQLLWSLIYFSRGIHPRAGQIARLAFFWLPRVDQWLDPKVTIDGASSIFFYGHSDSVGISSTGIVDYYSGAQRP